MTIPNRECLAPVGLHACRLAVRTAAMTALTIVASSWSAGALAQDLRIEPPTQPRQSEAGGTLAQPQLVQASEFIQATEARDRFKVDGDGVTVAVLDSGIFRGHSDFGKGTRIVAVRNFTHENGGDVDNVSDVYGHGSHIAGIVGANGVNVGIAPGVRFVVAKVLDDNGNGSFTAIKEALHWILQNVATQKVSVVNVSIGAFRNFTRDDDLNVTVGTIGPEICQRITRLRDLHIPVVVAAGNAYGVLQKPGMDFPGICHDSVSAGAVFDAAGGQLPPFRPNAVAKSRQPGQITPFSQRLHESVSLTLRTDIFAPGSPITSTGIGDTLAQSTQNGTSQAAPITAGVIALMQQLFRGSHDGRLPSVDDIEKWLREGSLPEFDGDNEDDNVAHTGREYRRLDALGALQAVAGSATP